MPKPARLLPLILLVVLASSGGAVASPATSGVDTVVYDHLAWVLGLFEGDATELTEAELDARFDSNFLRLVPPDEFIATVRQMAATLGPLELVEDQSRHAGEFVGLFRADSGDAVMISFALDEESGLMAGFFITPVTGSPALGLPDLR